MSRAYKDPATIARRGVDEWFARLSRNRQALIDGSFMHTDFEALFEDVREAVLSSADYAGMIATPADEGPVRQLASLDAGYLVGLHLGLRLSGGAR